MTFKELGLIAPLLRAVEKDGYTTPTPIQEQAIPVLLEGRDLIGCAQTGTGKTAAFALPILQNLSKTRGTGIRALVLTPTRELAIQIFDNFKGYGSGLSLKSAVIFGGVGQAPQVETLRRGVDILVATPGRLNDLIGQGFIKLNRLEVFVLDEADRMLDMGFINDVKRVLRELPSERQTLLFSATMPTEIEHLAKTILRDPTTVKVDSVTSTVDAIGQCIYFVDKGNKKRLLASLLSGEDVRSALVFTRTKHGADRVVKELEESGIRALAIHGNKSQTARQTALNSFKDGSLSVLIATDIAARGIDVPELSHVFNYDLPNEPETYIHRIGRTGRAGLGGDAISFCCYDELEYLRDIEKLTGIKIPEKTSNWPMVVLQKTEKVQQSQPRRTQQKPPRRDVSAPRSRADVPVTHARPRRTSYR
ncbi:MAG: DEAD/DEAH box helicase [Oscillospiraceae bacterium]